MLAAIVTIPIIIHKMGTDRFGLLTISWMFIGYFSLFDLGFSRALVNLVAVRLGTHDEHTIDKVAWTALISMFLIGTILTFLLFIVARLLVLHVLNVPLALQGETITAIHILAIAIPFVLLATGFRGILEAYQKFKSIAIIQLILGTATYVGIAFILDYSVKLPVIISYLILLKIVSMLAYSWLSIRRSKLLTSHVTLDTTELKKLITYGGWVTVSNVVSPVIDQLDRFMIGVFTTMTAVTFYTTPFDLIRKLNIIPGAIAGVLFPAFSTSFFADKERANKLFTRGIEIVEMIILPIATFLFIFSKDVMRIWLGKQFALHSSLVLQIFAATIILNNIAQIPFSYLYGMARPDIGAKIHLAELPFMALLLWPVISHFGIIGAAVLSSIRIFVDLLLLLYFVRKLTDTRLYIFRWLGIPTLTILLSLLVVVLANTILIKLLCYLFIISLLGVYAWNYTINAKQRRYLKRYVKRAFQIS